LPAPNYRPRDAHEALDAALAALADVVGGGLRAALPVPSLERGFLSWPYPPGAIIREYIAAPLSWVAGFCRGNTDATPAVINVTRATEVASLKSLLIAHLPLSDRAVAASICETAWGRRDRRHVSVDCRDGALVALAAFADVVGDEG
jgi:hypothetical protein